MTRKAWIKDGLSILSAVLTLAITAASLAIQPSQWLHTTQADFVPGESEGVVVTNLGDVKLASNTTTVGQMPEGVNILYDMRIVANGDLYIAAGPGGKLLRRRADQITQVAALENEHIYALDQTADGGLLLAISGEVSRLAILDGDQLKTVVELPGVRYIWDTVVDGNDVYLATGPDGKLLHVNMIEAFNARARAATGNGGKPVPPVAAPAPVKADEDKSGTDKKNDKQPEKAAAAEEAAPLPAGVRVLLDTVQANLLCLGRDKQGRLFVGTDTDGLVYRVTLSPTGEVDAFVLYDATEPEIFTLLVTADGTVYVGTADADQARPGRMEAAVEKEAGRPTPPPLPVQPKPDLPLPPKAEPKTTTPGSDAKSDSPATPGTPGTAKPAPAEAPKTPDAPSDSTKPEAVAAEPTQDQYDQLRDEIRNRLTKARTTGEMQAGPSAPRPPVRRTAGPAPSTSRPAGGATKQGNAVYRIDTSGFVTEVFRESALILKLLDDGDKLLVATGAEGQLYRIDIAAEETTIIADLEPEQIPALLKNSEGKILVGTGSPAMLVRLDEGFAATGTYTSPVLDATQISLWGKLMLTAAIPEGTSVSVQTRSGNVQDPERAAWSKWSVARNLTTDDAVGPLTPREVAIISPPARFLQYRLTLTGTGKSTSVVDRVSLAYVVPNLRPVVTAIRAVYPNEAKPGVRPAPRAAAGNNPNENPLPELTTLNVEWEASDPNNDQLRYTLEYRMAGSDKWLPLMEDITTNSYEWNTKRVPDGRYVLRVTATDGPDNPATMAKTVSRQSDPILIDNTAPTIGDRKTTVLNQVATITGTVTDGLSPIRLVQYAVDNTGKWHTVLPDDLIFDSTKETITVKIADLSTGSHVITLRAADTQGNTQYVAETVEVK